VNGLIAQSPSGAWSSGAAILTFVFPMLLFIAVAGALYVLYTKPEVAPGHRSAARPISYTSVPGEPTAQVSATPAADRSETPAAEGATDGRTGPAADETTGTTPGEAAGTGAAE
jgi:hypothetical protein